MSGIYIPGLRVPEENEDELWIAVRSDGTVTFNAEWGWTTNKGKAVSVPPHGDLIDRYDLKNKEITIDYDEWDDTFDDGLLFVTDLLDNAPVIIPAEPPLPVMYYPQVDGITPTVITPKEET